MAGNKDNVTANTQNILAVEMNESVLSKLH